MFFCCAGRFRFDFWKRPLCISGNKQDSDLHKELKGLKRLKYTHDLADGNHQKERNLCLLRRCLLWNKLYPSSSPEFLIQYEDLLHQPGVWVNLTEVAGTGTTAQLNLSPYVYYSFRVLALNQVGYSQPSQSSSQYRTNPSGDEHGHTGGGKKTATCKIFKNIHSLHHVLFGFPSSWWESIKCSGSRNRAWQLSHLLDGKISFFQIGNPLLWRAECCEPVSSCRFFLKRYVVQLKFHGSKVGAFFSKNILSVAADRVSVQRAQPGVQSAVETEGRGWGLVLKECGQRFPVCRVWDSNLRALRDQGPSSEWLWQRPRARSGGRILWRGLWVDWLLYTL